MFIFFMLPKANTFLASTCRVDGIVFYSKVSLTEKIIIFRTALYYDFSHQLLKLVLLP